MITQNKHNWVNNPRKWIWMLLGFIIIEKFLENGILVPILLKLPFGDLTSNILYKGIEVFLVLGLNIWLIKQKLYFSVNVTLKTSLFFLFGIGYISLFISSGPVNFCLQLYCGRCWRRFLKNCSLGEWFLGIYSNASLSVIWRSAALRLQLAYQVCCSACSIWVIWQISHWWIQFVRWLKLLGWGFCWQRFMWEPDHWSRRFLPIS